MGLKTENHRSKPKDVFMKGKGKYVWIKSQILRVLAEEGPLSKRQVHIKISSLKVKGYPERIPQSTFSDCVGMLLQQGFIREEPYYVGERISLNLRLTILGFSFVVYKMLHREWPDLLLKKKRILSNFYLLLVNLRKTLRLYDNKKIVERAGRFLEFRPVEKLLFSFIEKTLELCPVKIPDYMEVALECFSTKTIKRYAEKISMLGVEPDSKEIYEQSLEVANEAVGKYLLNEKHDLEIFINALKEASEGLNDLERKIVLQHFKDIIELKLYSIVPILDERKSMELKNKIAAADQDETVIPYHCMNCGHEGFAVISTRIFLSSPTILCEKCQKHTNCITIEKIIIGRD